MAQAETTLQTVTSIISSLARGDPFPAGNKQNGGLSLPGPESPTKARLAQELAALASRIGYLEQRAEIVSKALPDTPGELPASTPPKSKATESRATAPNPSNEPHTSTLEKQASLSIGTRKAHNLLAAKSTHRPDVVEDRNISEEDIAFLRQHIEKQAAQIQSQRALIDDIRSGLRQSEEQTREALLKVETEDVSMLERELWKHQQANQAFQKALREIGEVITRVANGDLTSRVQIQATELDEEIINFKSTINTMMDQLETFGSEVTRVAREVGTDGVLGGQAQIAGVRGIWKELTENGMCAECFPDDC